MAHFVELTAAQGGFPILINVEAISSLEPAGNGTALTMVSRDTVRVAEDFNVVRAALQSAATLAAPSIEMVADPAEVPAARREKK